MTVADDLLSYVTSGGTVRALLSTGTSVADTGVVRGPGVGAPTWAGVGAFG